MARHVLALAMTPLLLSPVLAQSQKVGDPPEAMNMRLVGMSDLQARSAYQPTIHRQGERIIAYIGHHGGTPDVPKPINKMTGQAEFNGTSILDVTDPANPKYLKHIPGLEGNYEEGGAQMVRVCDGKGLPKGDPAKTYMLRVFGGRAHQIWDVTEPANAVMLAQLESGRDTHKNWWECDTGIAYLVSGIPGWRTRRMMQVYDLSDPATGDSNPKTILVAHAPDHLVIRRNTLLTNPGLGSSFLLFAQAQKKKGVGFVFRDNITHAGTYGWGAEVPGLGSTPETALDGHFSSWEVEGNLLIGVQPGDRARYPRGQYWEDTLDRVGFVNMAAKDFRLRDKSRYQLGADVAALLATFHRYMSQAYWPTGQ